jgi:import inner membrane translocase subunit TIM50
MGFNDTREVLKSFEGTHIPSEFAKRDAIARARFQKQLADEKAKRTRGSGIAMLGNALGIKPMGSGLDGTEQTLSEGFDQGKSYQDLVRERGQRQYELLEKEIRENGEKWLKEMADEEEKMKEETMKGFKNSFVGFFGLGGSGGGGGGGGK